MEYTINFNEQFNSIEIAFSEKPGEAVRTALKALRFRWHSVKQVWYGYSDEASVRNAIEGNASATATATATAMAERYHGDRIRFYWNGMKVNGGQLARCYYDKCGGGIALLAKHYDDLPRQFFVVKNDTDLTTDYFDSDRGFIENSHPLYKYAEAMWKLNAIRDANKGYRSNLTPEDIERFKLETIGIGQPTDSELIATQTYLSK